VAKELIRYGLVVKTILLAALFLTGCAPQKPEYEFIPPASKAGLQCLQRCQAQATQCNNLITQQKNQCLVRARQRAVTELPGRVAAYDKAIVAWEAAMDRYERELSLYELQVRHTRMVRSISAANCRDRRDKDKRDCRPRRIYPYSVFWSDRPDHPGAAPRRPTLKTVQADIAAENCGQTTQQCETRYRQCYTRCGGTVRQR
jgi:hypothetical protein